MSQSRTSRPLPHPALSAADPELAALVGAEEQLQADTLRLIPSENYVSAAVLEATGTVLQNKYSEGYAGRRYYEGQQNIDRVETLAVERAKAVFGVEHANVQPYSGSPANLAAYLAFAEPGDTVLGMALPMGGHLTHGWGVSATGTWFRGVQYGVRPDTALIDFDEVRDLARKERPKIIFCGGTAVPRTIDFAAFGEIAREVDAVLVADIAHIAGLVAAGLHPNPVPHAHVVTTTTHKTLGGPRGGVILSTQELAKKINSAVFPGQQGGPLEHVIAAKAVSFKVAASDDFKERQQRTLDGARILAERLVQDDVKQHGVSVLSGGTDVHLVLVDLRDSELDGQQAEDRLHEVGITVNRNAIPNDPRPPMVTSGLRIGTPALATRGFGAEDFREVADIIAEALKPAYDAEALKARVTALAGKFPLYPSL
ncbi:serine hydroxymethyltransferase [Streptomyces angustmyceticus]|uniref:serine hydroxymethyltransferase n=1 Tax=Streptomyces angustmyceticus TaxID=285578 RepID=UPI000A3D177B|nr:serine hydroxymethyltransferase [Streptomyces angustmyceticus]